MSKTTPFIRDMVDEATKLGLKDIRVVQSKRHAVLSAKHPETGRDIQLGMSRSVKADGNHRLFKNARAHLRQQFRGGGNTRTK